MTTKITKDNISPGTITNTEISPSAAIASGKLTVDTGTLEANIGLLGFKMAVNEGLTVFNLVDGVVDEFHDESGTDESESSNCVYFASCDLYRNVSTPDGTPQQQPMASVSAGFTLTTVTEPDTSTAGTKTDDGEGTFAQLAICSFSSLCAFVWGAGGGHTNGSSAGGGGYTEGTVAVAQGQTLGIAVGEGGGQPCTSGGLFGAGPNEEGGGSGGGYGGPGGGGTFIFSDTCAQFRSCEVPAMMLAAGGGGGGGGHQGHGGAGGGTTGQSATNTHTAGGTGSGGSQTAGGQGGQAPGRPGPEYGNSGGLFLGGSHPGHGGGGGGYYGGGSGGAGPMTSAAHGGGGGGSGYIGHPQVTSGCTANGSNGSGGGTSKPNYVADTNEGGGPQAASSPAEAGEDGYILFTGTSDVCIPATATSATIISTAFTASSVPTTSRIVVFEEDIGSPTLNTHIIASISRDGGSTYTTATLEDAGYVTGSSGQRILTGQATISGQPSGQSMRWKLALSNQQVKIHGVSLQWA